MRKSNIIDKQEVRRLAAIKQVSATYSGNSRTWFFRKGDGAVVPLMVAPTASNVKSAVTRAAKG